MIGEATSSHYSPLVDRLSSSIRSAAEGSKAPNTLSGYRGQIKKFKDYVGGLGCPELLDHLKIPSKDTPLLIASWIQSSCSTAEEGEATASPPRKGHRGKKGATNFFGHAEKMRSSASSYYAVDQERGSRQFTERADGSWSGNPRCPTLWRNI